MSPRTWAILLAVGVVLVIIVIGTIIGRGSSDGATTIKTDAAVSTLQSLLDGVQRDTALGSCPFGPVTAIVHDVSDDVAFASTPDEAPAMIVKGDATAVDTVLCAASTPDDRLHTSRTMYVYATPVPKGSYTDYLTSTLLDGAKVKLADPHKYAGGTIYAWCTTPTADIKGGCGADWVAGDATVVFGMQVAGGEVTADQVTAALQHQLPALVERFGTDAPSSASVPTSATPDESTGSSGVVGGSVPTTVS